LLDSDLERYGRLVIVREGYDRRLFKQWCPNAVYVVCPEKNVAIVISRIVVCVYRSSPEVGICCMIGSKVIVAKAQFSKYCVRQYSPGCLVVDRYVNMSARLNYPPQLHQPSNVIGIDMCEDGKSNDAIQIIVGKRQNWQSIIM
jgi:hypothetical protein